MSHQMVLAGEKTGSPLGSIQKLFRSYQIKGEVSKSWWTLKFLYFCKYKNWGQDRVWDNGCSHSQRMSLVSIDKLWYLEFSMCKHTRTCMCAHTTPRTPHLCHFHRETWRNKYMDFRTGQCFVSDPCSLASYVICDFGNLFIFSGKTYTSRGAVRNN